MKFHPNIFIVNDDYHFVIITKKPSQVVLKIGRKTYYENNGGILPVLSPVHRFIIPQKVLDKAGRYEVSVRQVVEKRPYFPVYADPVKKVYAFKNDRYDDLKGFYFADTHNRYDKAKAEIKDIKDLDFIKKIPTRLFSYGVAVVVLLLAAVFSGNLTIDNAVLCLINGVVVSLASNGAFDALAKKTE